MTPEQCAEVVKNGVGEFGFAWMTDRDARARGKAELGLRSRALYHLGRAGVLGDASVEAVVAAEAFFPDAVVREHWLQGRAVVEPSDAAAWYSGCCQDAGRARFADDADTARLCVLVERVVDDAESLGLPLFAGWRALPRPDDAPGRLALLLNVLREHRGSSHAAAVALVGLGPLAAIVAGPNGATGARFFDWPEPYPNPEPFGVQWLRAEALTAEAAARPFGVLSETERAELVTLLDRALG